jgi:hypothetical protein
MFNIAIAFWHRPSAIAIRVEAWLLKNGYFYEMDKIFKRRLNVIAID